MGILIRMILLVGGLCAASGFVAFSFTELFTVVQEAMVPFIIISTAILAAALGYLISNLRR